MFSNSPFNFVSPISPRPSPGRWIALFLASLIAFSQLLIPTPARADYFWKNSVTSGNWSTATNWSAVGPGGADNAGVPGAGANVKIATTDFAAHAVTYDYAGPAITLNSLLIDAPLVFNNALYMSANSLSATTETFGQSGTGGIFQSGGTNTAGSLLLASTPAAFATYDLTSPGQLIVTGNAYVGGNSGSSGGFGQLIVHSGTVNIAGTLTIWDTSATSCQLISGSLTANTINVNTNPARFSWTGGSLTLNQTIDFSDGADPVYNGIIFGNTLTITASQSLTTTVWEYLYGNASTITQTGGSNSPSALYMGNTTGAGSPAAYNLSGGTLTAALFESIGYIGTYAGPSGTAYFNHTGGSNSMGTLYLAAVPGSSGTYTLNGPSAVVNVTANADIGVGGSAILDIFSGSMNVTGLFRVWNSTGTSVYFAGGALTVGALDTNGNPSHFLWTAGALTITNSSLTISPSGPLGATLILNSNQSLTVSTGSITNNGYISLAGAAVTGTITNNATIVGYGSIDGPTPLNNYGQITISSGTLNLTTPSLLNFGFLNLNGFSIAGSATLTNSGGTISGNGTIALSFTNSSGTFLIPSGGTAVTTPFSNAGAINLTTSSSNLAGGAITNTGSILGQGNISNPITNTGSIEAVGGTLILSGPVTNAATGVLRTATGTRLLFTTPLATNAGAISLTGGTFDNNNQPLNNTGQITGFGTLATGGAGLTNNGSITFTGGLTTILGNVTNAATKTINIKFNPAIFTGNIVNNGTIKTTATTVTFTGSYSGNAYISDPSTNIFQSDVTINSGGIMTGGVGDAFIFMTGAFTNNGAFSNAGSLQSSDPSINTGTFTQSGPQNWSNGTTFTNTAGSATFASDTGSGSSSPLAVIVNGGTVNFNANQHLNALTINGALASFAANSSLTNRTSKTNTLTFAGSPGAWSGKLDLKNNNLIVAGGGGANVQSQIRQAANLGAWTGPAGITSTSAQAAASTSTATALAYASGADFTAGNGLTSFDGFSFLSTDTLIMYTLAGDANMDKSVTFADFLQLQNNYNHVGTNWEQGDWNYDGSTTFADFLTLQNNYNKSLSVSSLQPPSAVPEPSAIALLAIGSLFLTRCRRFHYPARP